MDGIECVPPIAIPAKGVAFAACEAGRFDGSPLLRIRLTGRFDVRGRSGEDCLPRSRKARALLALLAAALPRPLARTQAAGLLWSRRDRKQALSSLRQCVHELQGLFAGLPVPLLRVSRHDLALRQELVATDRCEQGPDAWPDQMLLDDMDGIDPALDRWLAAERQRLTWELRATAESALARAIGPEPTIRAAERLLGLDGAHRGAWHALVGVLAQRGDRPAATAAFERCRTALAMAGAGEPSVETAALVAATQHTAPPPAPQMPLPRRSTGLPARTGARLAVAPLVSLGGDPGDALAFGITDAIIAALAGFRSISVLLREPPALHALQQGAGGEPGAAELDYVLEGTIQRAARRLRVNLRLIDLRDEEIAWAQRFERVEGDALAIQDEIAGEFAAQLDIQLLFREGRRRQRARATAPDAESLLLSAIPSIYQLDQRQYVQAGETLAAAVAIDPDFAAAHAWWAYWHVFLVGQGWTEDAEGAIRRAGELARRAVLLDPLDARALALAGHVQGFLGRSHSEAGALLDRALAINPCLPIAWVCSGLSRGYGGDHTEAIRRIRHGKRLSPLDPHAFFFDAALMMPTLLTGDFAGAAQIGERVGERHPHLTTAHKLHLSALGHLGRRDDAARLRERLGSIEPGFNLRQAVQRLPMSRQADRDLYVDGLRRAGTT